MRRQVVLAVFVALLPACGQLSSKDVRTDQMQAQFTAVTEGSGCFGRVYVSGQLITALDEGGNADVRLAEGEKLTVSYDDVKETMTEDAKTLDSPLYKADVAVSDTGKELVIALERPGNAPAPSSHVTLPDDFELESPESGDEYSRARELKVAWDNASSDEMRWMAKGDCIETIDGSGGAGAKDLRIPAKTLSGSGTCEVTLIVDRVRNGSVDPGLSSGSIKAIQRRTVHFDSTP